MSAKEKRKPVLRLVREDKYHVESYRVPAHDKRYPRARQPRCVVFFTRTGKFVGPTGPTADMRKAVRFYGPEADDLSRSLRGSTVWRLQ